MKSSLKSLFAFEAIVAFALLAMLGSTFVAVRIMASWYGMLVGVVLMVLSALTHNIGKRLRGFYLLSVILNFVGNGFSISAYYICFEKPLGFSALIATGLVWLFTILVGVIFFLLKNHSRAAKIIVFILSSLLLLASVVFWIENDDPLCIFGFFCLVAVLFFLYMLGKLTSGQPNTLRLASLASFGSYFLVAFVVLIILSEGDALDAFDWGGSGDTYSSKRKLRK